jgi:hypothetical protein
MAGGRLFPAKEDIMGSGLPATLPVVPDVAAILGYLLVLAVITAGGLALAIVMLAITVTGRWGEILERCSAYLAPVPLEEKRSLASLERSAIEHGTVILGSIDLRATKVTFAAARKNLSEACGLSPQTGAQRIRMLGFERPMWELIADQVEGTARYRAYTKAAEAMMDQRSLNEECRDACDLERTL